MDSQIDIGREEVRERKGGTGREEGRERGVRIKCEVRKGERD